MRSHVDLDSLRARLLNAGMPNTMAQPIPQVSYPAAPPNPFLISEPTYLSYGAQEAIIADYRRLLSISEYERLQAEARAQLAEHYLANIKSSQERELQAMSIKYNVASHAHNKTKKHLSAEQQRVEEKKRAIQFEIERDQALKRAVEAEEKVQALSNEIALLNEEKEDIRKILSSKKKTNNKKCKKSQPRTITKALPKLPMASTRNISEVTAASPVDVTNWTSSADELLAFLEEAPIDSPLNKQDAPSMPVLPNIQEDIPSYSQSLCTFFNEPVVSLSQEKAEKFTHGIG